MWLRFGINKNKALQTALLRKEGGMQSAPMFDIHTHILPGIDDGAATMEEAVAMARMAAAEGTTAMVATPHTCDGVYNTRKADVIDGCRALNEVLVQQGVPVHILPGQEVRLTPELLDLINEDQILTLNNSNFLLIELPLQVLPQYLPEMVRRIRCLDLIPIIAHPERNPALMSSMSMVEELHFRGALFQVTAGSFTGQFGRNVKKHAARLAGMDVVDFLGSDAHSATHRTPAMARGMALLNKITGDNVFRQYCELTAMVAPLNSMA